jgi:uncharacterized protein (DUF58 family)
VRFGHPTLTALVLAALGGYGVATGAGAGDERVVAIGIFALTLLVAGVVWPFVALARVTVQVVAPPSAHVGDTVALRVELRGRAGRLEVRALDPPGPWYAAVAPCTGTLPVVAARRGVHHAVRVQVRTSAPLGAFVRVRQARVHLPAPLEIAPRAVAEPVALTAGPDDPALVHGTAAPPGPGDAVRAVRPYLPGDPARLVHWPTSARRGEPVVREHDPPVTVGLALVVDLRGPSVATEHAAARAAGIGRAVLAAGGRLVLATAEAEGPVSAPVPDVRTLDRRLARAVPGEPGSPPDGWPARLVRALDRPTGAVVVAQA